MSMMANHRMELLGRISSKVSDFDNVRMLRRDGNYDENNLRRCLFRRLFDDSELLTENYRYFVSYVLGENEW